MHIAIVKKMNKKLFSKKTYSKKDFLDIVLLYAEGHNSFSFISRNFLSQSQTSYKIVESYRSSAVKRSVDGLTILMARQNIDTLAALGRPPG